ncbi:MAG: hypothetical protein HC911_08855 [Chloroflexaceae bacterium]|nr:hypothetical protein [Chloroflexaceae bacterium]
MSKRRDFADQIDAIELPPAPVIQRGQGLEGLITPQVAAIEVGTETELSFDEQDELRRCELIIERGLKTFFEVGAALARVRELRLYRTTHATFEAYCQDRWDFSKTYANNLIAATSVRENLTTIVVKHLPANEAQARPLTRLHDPEQQREVWQQALATAPEGRITAAHVEAVVRAFLEGIAATPPAPSTPAAPVRTLRHYLHEAHRLIGAYAPQLAQLRDTAQQTNDPSALAVLDLIERLTHLLAEAEQRGG